LLFVEEELVMLIKGAQKGPLLGDDDDQLASANSLQLLDHPLQVEAMLQGVGADHHVE